MLHRYNSFTEDLILESAINESMIFYTKDFKDSLIKLRNLKKSVIAQNLLEVEYTDVKPDMTFISIGENEGDIKFTQFKKAVSLIKKGIETNYTPDIAERLLNHAEKYYPENYSLQDIYIKGQIVHYHKMQELKKEVKDL